MMRASIPPLMATAGADWIEWIWNPPVAVAVLVLALLAAATVARGRDEQTAPSERVATGLEALTRTSICAGAGSVAGGALAVQLGGPGALVWMWVATVVGLGLVLREAQTGAPRTAPPSPTMATRIAALGLLVAAVLVGGAFQSKQLALALPSSVSHVQTLAAVVTALAAAAIIGSRALARLWWRVLTPLSLVLFVVVTALLFLRDATWLQLRLGDAWQQAFGIAPASTGIVAGGVAVAFSQGVLWAVVSGELGLGSTRQEAGLRPFAGRLGVLLAPLVATALIATSSALVVLTQPSERTRIVDGDLVPLERHQSLGLRPSPQVGQTIVLPEDAGFEAGKAYAMRLRANPRGHKLARLIPEENAVVLPDWEIAKDIDTVVFRSREARDAPAWDVRVPVTAEHLSGGDGPGFIRLRPADPELRFRRIIAHYELDSTPYVVLSDPTFIGVVEEAKSGDPALGRHLAMFEPKYEGRPYNPALHELFRAGFRGPYNDVETERAPWAYPATAQFDAPIGAVVDLRMEPDPRGVPVLRINRVGRLEAPPWDLLMDVREVVVRHATDPARDVIVPVQPRLDEYRIRFDALDPAWKDFRERSDEFVGVYARVPAVTFAAEVHGDARLPETYAGRRALVPIHPLPEPRGPFGALPYAPHPEELLTLGFRGPFLVQHGAAALRANAEDHLGAAGPWLLFGALFVLVAGTVAGWGQYARTALAEGFGGRAGMAALLLVLAAAAASPLWRASILAQLVAVAVVASFVPNVARSLRSRRPGA